MKKALSIILCLAMLVSVFPLSIFAAPAAVTDGNPASELDTGELSAEDTVTVAFNAGTGAAVTNMPETQTVRKNSTFTVPTASPVRDGYVFEGWTTSLESSSTVTSLRVASDTTFYAKWSKGGYLADFSNPGDKLNDYGNGLILADGTKFDFSDAENISIDTEKGEVTTTVNGADYYFNLSFPEGKRFSVNGMENVSIGYRTEALGQAVLVAYFSTEDETGKQHCGISDNDMVKDVFFSVEGDIEKSTVLNIPMTGLKNWKDYLKQYRVDFFQNSGSFPKSKVILEYVKFPGVDSLEVLDINVKAPVPSVEPYGVEAFVSNDKLEIVSIDWEGAFVADKYFNDNTAYTAKIVVKAKDGYAVSDAPALAKVNGETATVVSDGETATITYTFPETDTLVPVRVNVRTLGGVAAEINEAWGTLSLEAIVQARGEFIEETGVVWSIDESQHDIARVSQDGVVSAINDCDELIVTATSKYDPEVSGTISIKITNQAPNATVTFDGGSGETVRNLPASVQAKGDYELPKDTATTTRLNYALKGWSKTLGGEVIKTDFITDDVTYYAVWGYTKADQFGAATSTAFTAANSENTFTAAYVSGSPNYATITPTNTDVSKGVILYGEKSGNKGLFSGNDRFLPANAEYVELRTSLSPENIELSVGIATAGEDGSNKTELTTVVYEGDALSAIVDYDGTWYSYKIPAKDFSNWENYFEELKITFVNKDADGNAIAMDAFNVDFIKFVGRDVQALGVEVDAPVAAIEAPETVVVVQDEAVEVTGVEWTPALLDDKYFDSDTEYSVKVTVQLREGYVSFARTLAEVTINGEEADYKRINSSTGAEISYTFPKTEDIGEIQLANVKFHEMSDEGAVVVDEKYLVGSDIDFDTTVPANIPVGYNWLGWSLTQDGELLTGKFTVEADAEFYAVYEIVDFVDFADDIDDEECVTVEEGAVVLDGKWAIVTPDADATATLVVDGFGLMAADYDFVEIVFDANRESSGKANKFGEDLVPVITISDSTSSYAPALEKGEAVIANNTLSYKYTYNLATEDRTAKVNSIAIAPYEGEPVWAVASIKFIKNVAVTEAIAVTDIAVPETWETPDTEAAINDNYTVKSIEWTSESGFTADGSFAGSAEYTLTVVIDTKPGYKIGTEDVTINGETPDEVTFNTDGTVTAVVYYDATDALIDFTLTVADAIINTPEGTVKLVPTFSTNIPITDITWEITSNGFMGNSAVIDENGVVKASYDGTVEVKATSVYDPTKTATATVEITEQVIGYTVHFDANTTSEVTGMPEDVIVKYDYVLPKTAPEREGFVFAGWIKNPGDKLSVTKEYISKDTTYYALWVRGLSLEFFNKSLDSKYITIGGGENVTYNEEEGTLTYTANVTPIVYIQTGDKAALFNGKDNTVVEIRAKLSKGGEYRVSNYFASLDMDGNVLGPVYGGGNDPRFLANAFEYVWTVFQADTYRYITNDFSAKADWVEGRPNYIRIDLPIVSDPDMLVTVDYIRVVSYETDTVEITGVDAPVAKATPDTTAVSGDTSKYTVTNVEWVEPLLYDYYFDGNKEYTVAVTVKGAPGYVMSSAPSSIKFNGKVILEVDDDGNYIETTPISYNAETGELTFMYTFPATGDAGNTDYNTVTLVSKDNDGADVYDERLIFVGDKFDIGNVAAGSIPSGTRFIGWSDTEGATTPNITGVIDVTEDVTYYAVFEEITGFDYSNTYHTIGTVGKVGSTVEFKDGLAIVTPSGNKADSALATPVMNIDGRKFGYVEVYYNALLDSTHDIHYDNKFHAFLKPALKFSTVSAPNNFDAEGTLVDAQRVMVDGKAYYKYTYDMTTAPTWNGNIASLYLAPYSGYPIWGVGYINLVPNVNVGTANIEVNAPATWEAPDSLNEVKVNEGYLVTAISWKNNDEHFAALGKYTVTVTFRLAAGYMNFDVDATINGNDVAVTANEDSTYTVTYTFPETEDLKAVKVNISGKPKIGDAGRYVDLKAETVAVDGSYIPETGVTWSIGEGAEFATVSENGRVYPKANGTVEVIATSVYDEYVSNSHYIEITGQKELVKVTFDKNTQFEVTGMPEPVMVRGTFVPEVYDIKRDGFIFLGWSTDEDAMDITESFNITEDTTLYAKWGRGYEWSFDDASTSLAPYTGKVMTFEDGIATIKRIPGEKDEWGVLLDQTKLSSREIETALYTQLSIRYSQPASDTAIFYFATGDNKGNTRGADETAKVLEYSRPANALGEFQIVSFDMSTNSVWSSVYPYLERLRFDNQVLKNDENAYVQVDWVRLLTTIRDVTFDGNGGLIPLYGGEVEAFKESYNSGSIKLPTNPTRDGYTFLGWAKDTQDFNKLYRGTFTVTDTVTLYAIWAPAAELDGEKIVSPSEDITITIDIADEILVENNQTIVVKATGKISASGDEGVVLSFVDENGRPQSVKIADKLADTIIFDLSDYGFEGTVSDVVLTLPEGTTTGVTVDTLIFTTPELAATYAVDEMPGMPIRPTVIVTEGRVEEEHPGHNKYPEYQSGQMLSNVNKKSETEDSKTGETPERPKDEDIIMGGEKKDPGNAKFPFSQSYDNRFKDVTYSHWFFDDVINSYELGFMNGQTDKMFDPYGTVTVAQAVTVAARIHSIYNGAQIPAAAAGEAWYMPYVTYAKSKVIVTDGQFADFNAPITREQVANMFVRVAPSSWFTPINSFTTIPDMGENSAVLRLYNAGIVVGVDDDHNFNGAANISRAEFSAIINRIALLNSRIKVELPAPEVVEEAPAETAENAEVTEATETPAA